MGADRHSEIVRADDRSAKERRVGGRTGIDVDEILDVRILGWIPAQSSSGSASVLPADAVRRQTRGTINSLNCVAYRCKPRGVEHPSAKVSFGVLDPAVVARKERKVGSLGQLHCHRIPEIGTEFLQKKRNRGFDVIRIKSQGGCCVAESGLFLICTVNRRPLSCEQRVWNSLSFEALKNALNESGE